MIRIPRLRQMAVLTLAALLALVVENLVLIRELREANRSLRAMRDVLSAVDEEVRHVRADVEDNAETLDYLVSLAEQEPPGR